MDLSGAKRGTERSLEGEKREAVRINKFFQREKEEKKKKKKGNQSNPSQGVP